MSEIVEHAEMRGKYLCASCGKGFEIYSRWFTPGECQVCKQLTRQRTNGLYHPQQEPALLS